MATVSFDTLKLVDRLKAAGIPPEQAETVVRVIAEALDELVTKRDLEIALNPIKTDLAVLRSELISLKWMLGFLLGGMVAVLIKIFLPSA